MRSKSRTSTRWNKCISVRTWGTHMLRFDVTLRPLLYLYQFQLRLQNGCASSTNNFWHRPAAVLSSPYTSVNFFSCSNSISTYSMPNNLFFTSHFEKTSTKKYFVESIRYILETSLTLLSVKLGVKKFN